MASSRAESHALCTQLQAGDEVQHAPLQPGDISVHNERVMHGSGPNTSEVLLGGSSRASRLLLLLLLLFAAAPTCGLIQWPLPAADMLLCSRPIYRPILGAHVTLHASYLLRFNWVQKWRLGYVLAFRKADCVAEERAAGFTHSHNDVASWDAFHKHGAAAFAKKH